MTLEKVAVIVGPTAAGKTAVSLQVAEILDAEIISGDSMQIYRGMDIGTAKIHPEEMVGPGGKKITHHLIDILSPDQPFSVADFQTTCRSLIHEINGRGHLPLLVGGTGLYVNAVLDDYQFSASDDDQEFRQLKMAEAAAHGSAWLHDQLQSVDPQAALRIHANDSRRIIRALEVFQNSGQTISQQQSAQPRETLYQSAWAGVTAERQLLYQRINQRVDTMISDGFVGEVETLLGQGFPPSLNAMQSLGYRQISAYLTGLSTRQEAVRLMKRDTRHFAKRQLTWFRRDQRIKWFDLSEAENKALIAREIADYLGRSLDIAVE